MDKKLYKSVTKLIDDIMEKESPQWAKKKARILKQKGSLMEALEVDSLLALEIVSAVEKKFKVRIEEKDFIHFNNLENIVNLLEKKIKKSKKSSKAQPEL